MTRIIIFALIAFSALTHQSRAGEALTGQFHLCVDDHAIVFQNGKPLMEGHWNKSRKITKSAEVSVRVGDQLVFQLKNSGGVRFVAIQFVSSDLKTIVSFPVSAFRQLTDPAAKDFPPSSLDFGKFPAAKKRGGAGFLPFKSDSDGAWGETDVCALGVVIKAEMIKPLTK